MNSPKFSVILASYNKEALVGQTIESVLKQTLKDWELVIIDDQSPDNSVAVINKYIKDPRIRFFENEKNLGYIGTLKRLVAKASSDLVGILDCDDTLSPHALEKVVKTYADNPDGGFLYTQCYYCDENLQPQHLGFSRPIPKGSSNLRENAIHHFKTFKKSVYYQTEGHDEDIYFAEDIDLHLKLEEVSRPIFLDEPLYYYRVLPSSMTHSFKNVRINRSSTALAKYHAYLRRQGTTVPSLSRSEIGVVLFFGTINSLLANRIKPGRKLLVTLFSIHPWFLFDIGFYKEIIFKIRKIIFLKKEKPLLKV